MHMEGGGNANRITRFLKGFQEGASGEEALKPLLGGGSYEKLDSEISAEWARKGVRIRFAG